MPKKKVLITGITGQDGAHLANNLIKNNFEIYGGYRRESYNNLWRLRELNILDKIELLDFRLSEAHSVIKLLKLIQPDYIYHLAGYSYVADSFFNPGMAIDVNLLGVLNLLEGIKESSPHSRVFFASSSEIYAPDPMQSLKTEASLQQPINPYGLSKQAALNLVRIYRDTFGLFVCSGILFNHEGIFRGKEFVTRKITSKIAVMANSDGQFKPIQLGRLDAARDWGCAEEFSEAMQLVLQLDEPRDFVISTGRLTTVREFLACSAIEAGFSPMFEGEGVDEVCVDKNSGAVLAMVQPKYIRSNETPPHVGDSSLIESMTGWHANKTVNQIASLMTRTDLDRVKRGAL